MARQTHDSDGIANDQSAHRVFWIMDNCFAHRGQKAIDRLLNQVEIYFPIVQRKVLTPNYFSSLAELEQRLRAFQSHYEKTASPSQWTFTRRDLHALLAKLDSKRLATAA